MYVFFVKNYLIYQLSITTGTTQMEGTYNLFIEKITQDAYCGQYSIFKMYNMDKKYLEILRVKFFEISLTFIADNEYYNF